MRARHNLRNTAALLLILLLSACGLPPHTDTTTPERTAIAPPPGARPQRWQASPVLIELSHTAIGRDNFSALPGLIVYTDGRVISERYTFDGAGYTHSIELAQVEPAELCSLLWQIEASGFFDYDHDLYAHPRSYHFTSTTISVNAWRSRSVSAPSLDVLVNSPEYYSSWDLDPGDLVVPTALSETYKLLSSYLPENRVPYQPERIMLIVRPYESDHVAPLWPLDSPVLKDLVAMSEDGRWAQVALEGQIAADVSKVLSQNPTNLYSDGETVCHVSAGPLLPLELTERQGDQQSRFASEPTVELNCSL